MRFSPERIKELQRLLKEHCGVEYSEEQAQQAGIAIVRFIVVKERRRQELAKQGRNEYGKNSSEKLAAKS